MKKRISALTACILALSLLLAGCGAGRKAADIKNSGADSAYAPGEIISIFDDRPIVRTVDGSLLIDRYESEIALKPGVLLY